MFLISLALTAIMGVGFPLHYLLVGGATLVGWFGPNLYLYQRVYERSNLIQRSLPDAIDLLVVAGGAGQTAEYPPGPGGSLRDFAVPFTVGEDPVLPLALSRRAGGRAES